MSRHRKLKAKPLKAKNEILLFLRAVLEQLNMNVVSHNEDKPMLGFVISVRDDICDRMEVNILDVNRFS